MSDLGFANELADTNWAATPSLYVAELDSARREKK